MRVLLMYHAGELEVQRRAGVRDLAERVGRIIGSTIPPAAAAFLGARSFVIAATRGADDSVRASLLAGPRGFARATGESALTIAPESGHLDDVLADIEATAILGLLAIDFSTKRRMRANGTAVVRNGVIEMTTREVYSNCPQYIHAREDAIPPLVPSTTDSTFLSADQRAFIERAGTFFIASAHPESGADASHRGGAPGFVHAEPTRVSWPDYPGNNMFNTLGNLLVDPRCGLLFLDFPTGTSLRLEGHATLAGTTDRTVTVGIDRVR